jgi:hypothetical protein
MALGGGNGNGTGGINEYGYNLDIYGGGENNQVLTCYCVNPGPNGYCSGGCTPGSCTSSSECSSGGTGGGCGSSALMWCAILGACIAVGAYCASQQGCFIAGTKVKMADGTEKNIEDVEVHDKVVSWNEDTGKIETSTVKTLKQPIHDDMVILEWEHGTTISTFDHPYYSVVKQDWISYNPELTLARYDFDNVGELQVSTPVNPVGDIGLFLDKDENLVESKLLSIKENIGEVQTYIFELEGNNTFFANGILTHNKVIETGETKFGRSKTGGGALGGPGNNGISPGQRTNRTRGGRTGGRSMNNSGGGGYSTQSQTGGIQGTSMRLPSFQKVQSFNRNSGSGVTLTQDYYNRAVTRVRELQRTHDMTHVISVANRIMNSRLSVEDSVSQFKTQLGIYDSGDDYSIDCGYHCGLMIFWIIFLLLVGAEASN